MNILHVTPFYYPAVRYGGPIASVHGLCRALASGGHAVQVYTTNVDGDGFLDVPIDIGVELEGVVVTYLPISAPRKLLFSPLMFMRLREAIQHVDLVHLHSTFTLPGVFAAWLAKRYQIPYVYSPRGTLVRDLIRRKNWLLKVLWIAVFERMLVRGASLVHVTSEHEKAEMLKLGFRAKRISVIPNGIHRVPILCEVDFAPRNRRREILYVGRLSVEKGLDRLLLALPHIPGYELLVVGDGTQDFRRRLDAIALKAGVSNRVRFLGGLYGSELNLLHQRASIQVVPSYSENFGNVVLEAWVAGCPVVMTPEVGLSSFAVASGIGGVVPGEPRLLGEKVRELLNMPRVLFERAVKARTIAIQRFMWDGIAKEIIDEYTICRGKC